MNLLNTRARKAQHICIFGDPKTGKSTLASTVAAIAKKVIWISLDSGHGILYKLPQEQQSAVELVRLPDTKDFPVGFDTVNKLVTGLKQHICDDHGQVNCSVCTKKNGATWTDISLFDEPLSTVVVIDHISQLATSCMNFITKKKNDDFFPGWDEFRLQGILMDKILTNIQQAPYHIICLAHICETEMEDGAKRLVPLVGTVAFSRNSGKYFDHMIYCKVGSKKHAFGSSTTYLPSVITGSRTDVSIETQTEHTTLAPFFEGNLGDAIVETPILDDTLPASGSNILGAAAETVSIPSADDLNKAAVTLVANMQAETPAERAKRILDGMRKKG